MLLSAKQDHHQVRAERVDHVSVDTTTDELAVSEKPLARPLPYLCLSGVWGRLTHGSRLSASPLGFLLFVFIDFSLVLGNSYLRL